MRCEFYLAVLLYKTWVYCLLILRESYTLFFTHYKNNKLLNKAVTCKLRVTASTVPFYLFCTSLRLPISFITVTRRMSFFAAWHVFHNLTFSLFQYSFVELWCSFNMSRNRTSFLQAEGSVVPFKIFNGQTFYYLLSENSLTNHTPHKPLTIRFTPEPFERLTTVVPQGCTVI